MKKFASLTLAGAGVVLAFAACGTHAAKRIARPAPVPPSSVAASTTSTPISPTAAAPGADTATHPATTTTAPAARESNGCPTTVDVLKAALKASNNGEYSRIADGTTLQNPECYDNFATVLVVPEGGGQPSRILFGYDAATKSWRPLNTGSAGYCAGYVPAEIATHFTGCG